MAEFTDATGRPGPSRWELGLYPEGQDDYPLHGVSWYEAIAYSRFVGAQVPTVHHWRNAAGANGIFSNVLELNNFSGKGPARAGTFRATAPSAPMTWPATSRSGAGTRCEASATSWRRMERAELPVYRRGWALTFRARLRQRLSHDAPERSLRSARECYGARRSPRRDYTSEKPLETREDIDSGRLAYFGVSMGAALAPISLAVEPRFKAAIH